LRTLVNQKDTTIAELEKMLEAARSSGGGGVAQEEVDILKNEIATLKNQLEEANIQLEDARMPAGEGGGDAELMKERDELKERLMEYEIIEEDLANLKRYQQENEELKKTIAEMKGGADAPAPADNPVEVEAATPEPEPEPEVAEEVAPVEEPAAEEEATPPSEEEVVAEAAPPSEETASVPANSGEQKSAEELLSEFEKMLG
jgi:myosin heavy subunit